MINGKMGFTTCFDRQAGEVSKFSAYGMFSDFLFQTTTYAVRGEAYGSSKMTTYNVRGEASKGLKIFENTFLVNMFVCREWQKQSSSLWARVGRMVGQ